MFVLLPAGTWWMEMRLPLSLHNWFITEKAHLGHIIIRKQHITVQNPSFSMFMFAWCAQSQTRVCDC